MKDPSEPTTDDPELASDALLAEDRCRCGSAYKKMEQQEEGSFGYYKMAGEPVPKCGSCGALWAPVTQTRGVRRANEKRKQHRKILKWVTVPIAGHSRTPVSERSERSG